MNKDVILAFIAGTLLGGISAAVFTGKRFEKATEARDAEWEDYMKTLEEEVARHCENCQIQQDVVEDEDIEEEEYNRDALVEQLNMSVEASSEAVEKMRDENGLVSYDKFSQKKNTKEDEAKAEDDNKEEPVRVQDEYLDEDELAEDLTIHYITEDEYHDEKEEYDKLELTYLEGSDVFITDEREKYTAYPAIGGRDGLEEALESSPTGVVYVRNDALEMDFAIVSDIRDYDTYMEETRD